jgi:PAS domain S-box-containing protein
LRYEVKSTHGAVPNFLGTRQERNLTLLPQHVQLYAMTQTEKSLAFPSISDYDIGEQLYVGSRTSVYRAVKTTNQQPVVIKVMRREYPTFGELVQFRNQYTIAKNLQMAGIVRPIALELMANGYALVMEDQGGVSIAQYLEDRALNLTEILEIALQLTTILHDLHQQRVIHKDIKPANILIHPNSWQIMLIDFSIASLLPKETQEIQSPNVLEGTLAYIAPEQTGRMNRGIDYRADFYALGVTLYELLTGQVPFCSDDPLEVIHSHIAKNPIPVPEIKPEVPMMVGAIVTKLMAKNAEDRYQSALGLKHDLQQCLTQWQATGAISEFELGLRDLSDRFLIPEKLYGRETEVQILLAAFDRVAQGSSELMLVAGFSGIGKTAVVNEVHKPIIRQKGYFIKGKFDQFNRNIPLSAFVQAFRNLMAQLHSETDAQLEQWRDQILQAVGENGQVLMEVIPELENIIGKQPPVPELSGTAAQNRFNLLFQKFIQVFTTPAHPLVIFLDDLQWADSASLQLLHLLMSDSNYLLMLGAYRDNEVSPIHPFILMVEELQKAAIVNTLTLAPLTFEDTNRLIADTLKCSRELAQPLTELVDRKTKGNPFFTTQFLKALYEEGHITFNGVGRASQDESHRYWECDIAHINTLALTDDIVEFMALQLQKLPPATQQVLKLAACIGNQFDLETLAIVSEQSPPETATALWRALQEGLVLPTSQVYKFFQSAEVEPANTPNSVNPLYRFLHDRVQQAAYSLIPDRQKQATHLKIGQLLLTNTLAEDLENRVFDIVNQLNMGAGLIDEALLKEQLVQLNVTAGRKAKLATAYAAAVSYLNTGLTLLTANSWQEQYSLTLELYELLAESEYLNTNFETSKNLVQQTLIYAQNPLEKIKVYEIQIQSYTAQNKLLEAIDTGREALGLLGVDFPQFCDFETTVSEHQQLKIILGERPIESLASLPSLQEPTQAAALRILVGLFASVYLAKPELLPIKIFTMVKICIQYGNSSRAAIAYSLYGLFLCATGEIERGYQFGQLATTILEHFQAKELTSKVYLTFALFIKHWKNSIRSTLPVFLAGLSSGLEHGDMEYVGYCANCYCQFLFWTGENLEFAEAEADKYCQLMEDLKQDVSLVWGNIWRQMVMNLSNKAVNPKILVGSCFDEVASLPYLIQSQNINGICYVYLGKLLLLYLFEDYQNAQECAGNFERYEQGAAGLLIIPLKNFYQSLTLLSLYPSADQEQKIQALEKVAKNQKSMELWAHHAPMNYLHKFQLVQAEIYRSLGQNYAAGDWYDRAIAGAKQNNFIQEEALAHELAAKFYLNWGREKVAAGYMQEAYYGYAHWGAKAKVQDLEHRYPQLLAPILQRQQMVLSATETLTETAFYATAQTISTQCSSSGNTSISATLDLATVLQASQTLSREIQIDKLLATLLRTILENAGADKGVLLMPRKNQWFVEAVATADHPAIVQSIALSDSLDIPQGLINTIKRSLQSLVVVDVALHPTLATDPYVRQQQPKSLLCTPILNQGKLVAILYLENHVSSGAFTHDRVELLNFLCAQAAISLENARLYQQSQTTLQELQQSQQILREIIDNIPQVIFWKDYNSTYLGCNQKFAIQAGLETPRDIIGKTDYDLPWSQEEADSYRNNDRKVMASNQPELHIIETQQQQDGSITWLDTRKIPLCNEAGEVYGILGCYEDISDRKAAEAQIQQKNQELEQALIQVQQSQTQVVQSEKMSALGNLVAGVAHEINNPIGFLNGSINNAKDYVQDLLGHLALYQQYHPHPASAVEANAEDIDLEYLSEDLPNLLNSMKGATDRIKGISTSLRVFSRADTDYKVKANLHEGIDSTLLILKYRLNANSYRPAIVVIRDYGQLPLVECFPGQLNQVFMNILANAIDVFDETAQTQSFAELETQPQQITIRTTIDTNQVQIQIRDNGKGMTAEVKAKVFDHLFTTKGVGKGTGLGLAIARQIVVEKHGGSLEVQSELGQGTEFCIQLPIENILPVSN